MINCSLALVAGMIKNHWPFQDFRTVAEWLGVYNYPLPSERQRFLPLLHSALDLWEENFIGCRMAIETLSLTDQQEVWKWLQKE